MNWPNFILLFPLLHEILDNMCVVLVSWPGCDVMNFEITLMFLIKPFFLYSQKVKTKRTKRAFNMKLKTFFIILEGLSLKQIKLITFRRWESDFVKIKCPVLFKIGVQPWIAFWTFLGNHDMFNLRL